MSKADLVNEIHRNARVNFPRRNVITKDIDDLWQANLIDMQSVSKENKNFRFILTVIDTFSKYSWAFTIKTKSDSLNNVIYEYNHTYHRTISEIPANVNNKSKKRILQRYLRLVKNDNVKRKFNVGDYVRISKYKGTFEKGYTPNWSTEIFKIRKLQNTIPTTYLIEDTIRGQQILGGFYTQELQKTKYPNKYLVEKVLRRKGNKVLVKWLGLSSSENSCIDKSNIL
ncbi:unnamed protein product [Parnassius mnemosyne]|uniref:Chromo domain-containing protein n=1 Tax=Parnassius mnemosyne TaxID=213953 RepID=A0AAV1LT33_9NEOP